MRAGLLPLLTAAVALSGAAVAAKRQKVVQPIGQSASYACADGRTIELLFAGDGSAVLTLARETHTLTANDGMHFAGEGFGWTSRSPTAGQLTAGATSPINCRVR